MCFYCTIHQFSLIKKFLILHKSCKFVQFRGEILNEKALFAFISGIEIRQNLKYEEV